MKLFLRPLGTSCGHAVDVDSPRLTVGRAEGCDLQLHHGLVSRRHAEVFVREDGIFIRDLESSNGTFVNGEPVHGLRRLRDGDVVAFAIIPYEVQIGRGVKNRIRMLYSSLDERQERNGKEPSWH